MGYENRFCAIWLVLSLSLRVAHQYLLYDICRTSHLSPGGLVESGNITSSNFPGTLPEKHWRDNNCRLSITACPECGIELKFTEVLLPDCGATVIQQGSCIPGCDHLHYYEEDYPTETASNCFGGPSCSTIRTMSNRLHLTFCHSTNYLHSTRTKRFRLEYSIFKKQFNFTGSSKDPVSNGTFTSPNFPHGYAHRDEVYYYLIENKNKDGHIRLFFNDWSLSASSVITIYYHNDIHPERYLTRSGTDQRPFVISSGPSLYVKFAMGEDLYSEPYMGFTAIYQFMDDPYWPDKPFTVCGKYFHSTFGGQFKFENSRCWPGDRVDCIWVVMKYRDNCCNYHEYVSLRIDNLTIFSGSDSLEIRAGNTSTSPLVGHYDSSHLVQREYTNEHGFYVRLRATCSTARQLQATFVSYANSVGVSNGCRHYYHFPCGQGKCISKTLTCDGIDHCGDGSDEMSCEAVTTPSTPLPCETHYLCKSGSGWYCITQRCDGKADCSDQSDEQNCDGDPVDGPTLPTASPHTSWFQNLSTFLPIVLIVLVLLIVACVVFSCFAKRKRLARLRRGAGRNGTSTRLSINVDIQHQTDNPPSYNEALMFNPASGVMNFGFSRSESSDFIPQPPPYSPTDEGPLPTIMSVPLSRGRFYPFFPRDFYPPPTLPELPPVTLPVNQHQASPPPAPREESHYVNDTSEVASAENEANSTQVSSVQSGVTLRVPDLQSCDTPHVTQEANREDTNESSGPSTPNSAPRALNVGSSSTLPSIRGNLSTPNLQNSRDESRRYGSLGARTRSSSPYNTLTNLIRRRFSNQSSQSFNLFNRRGSSSTLSSNASLPKNTPHIKDCLPAADNKQPKVDPPSGSEQAHTSAADNKPPIVNQPSSGEQAQTSSAQASEEEPVLSLRQTEDHSMTYV